ncbi:MAG: hypothetical protein Crog4KO_23960 [Crocinitomicaceae bacterium]
MFSMKENQHDGNNSVTFTEDQIKAVKKIRQWGETKEIYKMINLLVEEYTKQINSKELQIHWTSEDGFIKNEANFS